MNHSFTSYKSYYCPVEKKTINGRDLVRIEGDKVIMKSFKTTDGKEAKMLEVISTRNR